MEDNDNKPLLGYFVSDWNKKIYRDDDGNMMSGGLHAEELWDEFQIKSGPKFSDACWSHIPEKWADDVRLMISEVQDKFGGKVEFRQLKEKFCSLTVYFSAENDEIREEVNKIISSCIERLQEKGVHPPSRS